MNNHMKIGYFDHAALEKSEIAVRQRLDKEVVCGLLREYGQLEMGEEGFLGRVDGFPFWWVEDGYLLCGSPIKPSVVGFVALLAERTGCEILNDSMLTVSTSEEFVNYSKWLSAVQHELDTRVVLPPGQHPVDPSKQDIDPIGFALERLQTNMKWIDDYRASFEKLRNSEPDRAERELRYLEDATEQGVAYLQRLTELLLAGYTIDPNKRLPKGLCEPFWYGWVKNRLRKV
jgi:hypothetical protein